MYAPPAMPLPAGLFLSAYDPSDLPGGSVDPLGFERGYLALAERLLPDLTNVAAAPRYFSMLCAAAEVARDVPVTRRDGVRERDRVILRFERLWAAALVLAARTDGLDTSGLRGVTRALKHVDPIEPDGTSPVGSAYDLLKRQTPAGAIGIYGAVCVRMRLLADRQTMRPTEDWGRRLARAYLDGTACPPAVREAALDAKATVPAAMLTAWGRRAHLAARTTPGEAAVFREATRQSPLRATMLGLLHATPPLEDETELARLARIESGLAARGEAAPIREAIAVVRAYEDAYRHALLVLERLLALCDRTAVPVATREELDADEGLGNAFAGMAAARDAVAVAVAGVTDADLLQATRRLDDVRRFLDEAAAATSPAELCLAVLARHRDVQQGKFDGGRRKSPWVEWQGDHVRRTLTQSGQASKALTPAGIAPHFYRCAAADALNEAAHVE